MNKSIITFAALLMASGASAQSLVDRVDRAKATVEAAPMRTEFVSFDLREQAEKDDRAKNKYYVELPADGTFEVPVLWLDREFFLHVEGAAEGELAVNGNRAGRLRGGLQEVNITRWITDGANRIEVPAHRLAYVYSQPRIRVEDYIVDTGLDSLGKHGVLRLDVVVANGYNFPEGVNIGYDIYNPQGKLLHFDNRNVTVRGNGRDTVRFELDVWGMPANLWTAENPRLHKVMIVVQHERRYTEYIPLRVGFGRTEVVDGRLVRNGKAVNIKAVRHDATDRKKAAADLAKFKKAGYNTIMVDRPQPYWFYDLADQTGFYIFDQPDEASGGANDPELLGDYLMRTKAMFSRSRNHVSVAGWALGMPDGNGYNLYRTYLWLKAADPLRPVVYNGAGGEWNSDMGPIHADGN
jgi:beta-galactosidase